MAHGPLLGRPEPEDTAMERAVLGSVFLDPESVHRIQEAGLSSADFYHESHRILFEAILAVTREGTLPDAGLVRSYVRDKSKLEQVGGASYIAGLMGAVPTVANLSEYVKNVQEKATLRRLLTTARAIEAQVYSGEGGADAALEVAEKAILALGEAQNYRGFHRLDEVVATVLKDIQDRFENPSDVTGITTGFRDLDEKLAGLQRSDLIIVAARPSMGKTAFSLNLVANAALIDKVSVAFFSLEMAKEQLATRLLSSEARVSGTRIRTGKFRQDDLPALVAGGERLDQARIHIDDTANISLAELRSKCRRLKMEKGLDLVVVDYLQLMRADRVDLSSNASREQEISSISRGLKGLAKDLNLPVIALSQLNRGVEQRADKRPMLSDLRESGAIEQDADVIVFLYRDEVYNPNTEHKGVAEVLIRKQRSGPTGDVHLAWRSEFTRFENLAGNDW